MRHCMSIIGTICLEFLRLATAPGIGTDSANSGRQRPTKVHLMHPLKAAHAPPRAQRFRLGATSAPVLSAPSGSSSVAMCGLHWHRQLLGNQKDSQLQNFARHGPCRCGGSSANTRLVCAQPATMLRSLRRYTSVAWQMPTSSSSFIFISVCFSPLT